MWWLWVLVVLSIMIYLIVGANIAPYDYGGWFDGWQYCLILVFWLPLFICLNIIKLMRRTRR